MQRSLYSGNLFLDVMEAGSRTKYSGYWQPEKILCVRLISYMPLYVTLSGTSLGNMRIISYAIGTSAGLPMLVEGFPMLHRRETQILVRW